eukprot:TRINITY_DN3191_c0_g1_i1.p2 TRINITY_DN3191_c0_g1~~TRINITY_DN3191_c0_g1_i1.p2  ORF type:complete len:112 (+),score=4.92 TRINITY_DN3191_c0_g1_i1:609-944(+)
MVQRVRYVFGIEISSLSRALEAAATVCSELFRTGVYFTCLSCPASGDLQQPYVNANAAKQFNAKATSLMCKSLCHSLGVVYSASCLVNVAPPFCTFICCFSNLDGVSLVTI